MHVCTLLTGAAYLGLGLVVRAGSQALSRAARAAGRAGHGLQAFDLLAASNRQALVRKLLYTMLHRFGSQPLALALALARAPHRPSLYRYTFKSLLARTGPGGWSASGSAELAAGAARVASCAQHARQSSLLLLPWLLCQCHVSRRSRPSARMVPIARTSVSPLSP